MKELVFEVKDFITKELLRLVVVPATTKVKEVEASIWNMGALGDIELKEIR